MKLIDSTGERFGRLTVLRKTNRKYKGDKFLYDCICDCGNHTLASLSSLKSGKVKSCGCLNKERLAEQKNDLVGKRFGRLTVLEISKNKHLSTRNMPTFWLCKCDCGSLVNVWRESLLSGTTKSCGCLLHDTRKDLVQNMNDANKQKYLVEGTLLSSLKKKKGSNNTSGTKGIYYLKDKHTWEARLTFKKEIKLRKQFKNKQDAIDARKEAEAKYFKPILEKYGSKLEDSNDK